jgi:hypothetical protein
LIGDYGDELLPQKFGAVAGTLENWSSEVADCLRKVARYGELLEHGHDDLAGQFVEDEARDKALSAVLRVMNTPVSRPEQVVDKLQVMLEGYLLLDLREEDAPKLFALVSADLSRAATRLREAELA